MTRRDEWEARWPPSALCVCGHTWALHAIDRAGARCSLYEASEGQPFTRCPCDGFTVVAVSA